MFKPGDKVKTRNGSTFSNGEYIVTVKRVGEEKENATVWLEETSTWVRSDYIELVETIKNPPLRIVPKRIWEEQRKQELMKAIIEHISAGLHVPIEWLEEYNEFE